MTQTILDQKLIMRTTYGNMYITIHALSLFSLICRIHVQYVYISSSSNRYVDIKVVKMYPRMTLNGSLHRAMSYLYKYDVCTVMQHIGTVVISLFFQRDNFTKQGFWAQHHKYVCGFIDVPSCYYFTCICWTFSCLTFCKN